MKEGIHPEYQDVVFLDMSTGKSFLCRSTVQVKETMELDGKAYPCVKVSVTSSSHPFYLGGQGVIDPKKRIDKFRKKYERVIAPSLEGEIDTSKHEIEKPEILSKKKVGAKKKTFKKK